ncbi:hypothetical protein A4A49_58190, partial [Nicotiana attenuata]
VETFGENASGETLSSEEVQHLRRLLNKLDTSNVGTSNYVQSGIAFNAHLNSWIIDSGANRHMTGSSKGFQNYSPSPKGDCVRIANGSLTPVSGTGSVICTPDITLSSVLHVPEFPVNLLSVNAITKQLKCSVEFFLDYCVFQDLQTRKRIGSGESYKNEEMIPTVEMIPTIEATKTGECEIEERIQGETIGRLNKPDLMTYSRKKRAEEVIVQSTEAHPSSAVETSSTGELSTFPSELDVPIAHRKGVRSCTKHPLSNFVSYNSLSPSYRAFALSIFSVSIPQNWREAFADSKWKQAMIEEMKALSKNETWDLVTSPLNKWL